MSSSNPQQSFASYPSTTTHSATTHSAVKNPKVSAIKTNLGWGISVMLVMFMLFSATGKFANFEGRDALFQRLGWDSEMMYYIGIMEVIVALFYLVPQTAFIGAILLTAYLGGVIATHVRVSNPFLFPIAIGVLLWIGLALRDDRIIALVYDNVDESPKDVNLTHSDRETLNAQVSHETSNTTPLPNS